MAETMEMINPSKNANRLGVVLLMRDQYIIYPE